MLLRSPTRSPDRLSKLRSRSEPGCSSLSRVLPVKQVSRSLAARGDDSTHHDLLHHRLGPLLCPRPSRRVPCRRQRSSSPSTQHHVHKQRRPLDLRHHYLQAVAECSTLGRSQLLRSLRPEERPPRARSRSSPPLRWDCSLSAAFQEYCAFCDAVRSLYRTLRTVRGPTVAQQASMNWGTSRVALLPRLHRVQLQQSRVLAAVVASKAGT